MYLWISPLAGGVIEVGVEADYFKIVQFGDRVDERVVKVETLGLCVGDDEGKLSRIKAKDRDLAADEVVDNCLEDLSGVLRTR